MPSMVERANPKTTPLHKELFEDGNKPVDCRDILTDDTIESVKDKLQQIAASRQEDESDLSAFNGLKIQGSEDKAKEEEIGNFANEAHQYTNTTHIIFADIDLTDPAVEAVAAKMQAVFKMKGKKKFGK